MQQIVSFIASVVVGILSGLVTNFIQMTCLQNWALRQV
jgi:hypothetical protein